MRKFIIAGLLAATIIPGVASAQSYGEVRRSERHLHEEQRDLRDARRYGDRRDVTARCRSRFFGTALSPVPQT